MLELNDDLIRTTAFLLTLTQLDEPLPDEVQSKLNKIAEDIQNSSDNISIGLLLDDIAEECSQLTNTYFDELGILNPGDLFRNKGLGFGPKPLPQERTKELLNSVMVNSLVFEIVKDTDSVSASKSPHLLTRIKQLQEFILGNSHE